MKFIDLSQPLEEGAPNCPTHPPVVLRITEHSDGGPDSWQMEYLNFASHTGSHVDAPRHKVQGGATLSQMALESFAGPAVLLDLRGLEPGTAIGRSLLEAAGSEALEGQIVLLATGWDRKRQATDLWWHDSPYLSAEGAQFLVESGIKGVGIDHFSVGGSGAANARTHSVLLEAGIWILEELCFEAEVFDLNWPQLLLALPINIKDGSGAPCRPVLCQL